MSRPLRSALLLLVGLLACDDKQGPGPADAAAEAPARDAGREAPPDASGPPRMMHPQRVSGTRLKAVNVVGDDGTRRDWGLHDSTRNEPCRHARAEDGKLRCMPGATVATAFTDAACTKPVAVTSSACSQKYAGETLPFSYEENRTRLRLIGAPVTASALYGALVNSNSVTCRPIELGPGQQVFAVGEPIEPGAFVEVSEENKLFGAELPVAARYHVYADGARARVAITDAKLGGDCHIRLAPDGSERCFPVGPGAAAPAGSMMFADNACTVPLTNAVPADQMVKFALVDEYAPEGAHLYRTRAAHRGPVFWGGIGSCRSREPLSPDQVAFTYARDDEVPASMLARVESWPDGGSRLRDEATVIVDGAVFPEARLILTLFDPVHAQDCSFWSVGEGGQRCVPTPKPPVVFGDAACTKPVFTPDRRPVEPGSSATRNSPPARHIVTSEAEERCPGAPNTVYELGPPAPEQYARREAGCERLGALEGYYYLGARADVNRFVKGEIRIE